MECQASCCACLNAFQSDGAHVPVLLTCSHHICSECSQSSHSSEIICPQCSGVSAAPLQKDYEYMRILVNQENVAKTKSETSLIICEQCHSSTASVACDVCDISICKSCDMALHGIEANASHERKIISDIDREICENHIEPLTEYCVKCKVAVCALCTSSTHARHKTRDLLKAAEELRNSLRNLSAETAPYISKGESIARYIDEYSSSVKDTQGNYTVKLAAINVINNQFEKLQEALQLRRQELLEQVDSALTSRVAVLGEQHKMALDIVGKQLDAVKAANSVACSRDGAVCRDYATARSRLKASIDIDIGELIGPIVDLSVPILFEPELRAVLGLVKHLGKVDGMGSTTQGMDLGSLIEILNQAQESKAPGPSTNGQSTGDKSEGERTSDTSTIKADRVTQDMSGKRAAGSKKGSTTTVGKRGNSSQQQPAAAASTAAASSVTVTEAELDETEHLGRIFQTDLRYPDLYVGLKLDVLDTANRWAEAEIIDMNPEQKSVLVSYLYWGDEWNEWVTDISGGIAPLKTHTFRVGGPLLRGQRVQVRHIDTEAWVEGFISDMDEFMAEVYYEDINDDTGESTAHTVWLDTRDDQIRPFGFSGDDEEDESSDEEETKPVVGRGGRGGNTSVSTTKTASISSNSGKGRGRGAADDEDDDNSHKSKRKRR